ncbi:SDR family NAD(P)-dependent oxidoreductase [Streptomyces mirabilis]|jgi:NAD(P)-dependent dehydrogenase (short-subunit alcohol dehydrogenase family)|uniref:NAD(P)-dependent dehydrogenase, short-chain alcohol dehydrogenase family n=1 Tax=Streptomyces mirabilis TaxID=68239 RepID=A0A1I2MYV4_9ACTN|nr:SDR family oxidoreductase [Streptomyces mirabilis]SFF96278.1 NAD(P)-dependent dehydrogenase, short-chain alcohol dehydrogenase family [Streptomyces mirabilis]
MSTHSQKVAVITGASQGIGAGLVVAYRKLGYAVVATSRTIAPSQDPDILTVQGDIADRATAERVIATGLEQFGRIDTLVNNAGIFISNAFTDFTEEDYDAVLGVNLAGFFRITQLATRQMLTQGGGHVVQITSTLADQANSNVKSVLAALTKGGLQSATRALAIEYATRGIRSNAVALGTIKTPMTAGYWDDLGALHPVGRIGEVSDVVDAVMYLENAPFVTGEILHVDGGQIAGH